MTGFIRNLNVQALGCIALWFIGGVALRSTALLEPDQPIAQENCSEEDTGLPITLNDNQALHLVAER